jgi:hypothetical protein
MRHALPIAIAAALALAACATVPPEAMLDEAVSNTRTESNGDVITEYRVAGTLRMIKVQPPRGPAYYIHDRDGDGRLDRNKGEAPQVWWNLYEW